MDIAVGAAQRAGRCASDLEQVFRPIAEQQALAFKVELGEGIPDTITTDEHRVQQILKNLLSNAHKFTETGSVTLRVVHPPPRARPTATRT